jgi:hypothetical protein
VAERGSSRAVLKLRLAIYGTVAVLGLAALWVRGHGGAEAEPAPAPKLTQLDGRTDDGAPTWVTVMDGRIENVAIQWRASACTGNATWPGFGLIFRDTFDNFSREGRAFSVRDSHAFATEDGWDARRTVEVSGRLSADGHHAEGWAWAGGAFFRDGRPGEVCDSGRHHWSVARP